MKNNIAKEKITKDIIIDFLHCEYKAYRKLHKKKYIKSEYEKLQDSLMHKYRAEATRHFFELGCKIKLPKTAMSLTKILNKKIAVATNISVSNDVASVCIDAMLQDPKSSFSADHQHPDYKVIMFLYREGIMKADKLLLAFCILLILEDHNINSIVGQIIHGSKFSKRTIKIDRLIDQANNLLRELVKLRNSNDPPRFFLQSHCKICGFIDHCNSKAIQKDDLSLLRTLKPKEITKLNNKGIFSVKQYSYTFRPSRRKKKSQNRGRSHNAALKALAIRNNKIYVYETPVLPQSIVNIYFDVEGLPDRHFYYLVGIVIQEKDKIKKISFWANNDREELKIFQDFIDLVDTYDYYYLYHYGNYDKRYLKHMSKKTGIDKDQKMTKIIDRCCNLLSFFHSHIYLPIYSNELKAVAKYLDFNWSDPMADGIKSIIWRINWELTRESYLKENLIRYNCEDCLALIPIRNLIESVINNDKTEKYVENKFGETESSKYSYYRDIRNQSIFRPDFIIPEMEYITKCSYFDYQRERVFVKTNEHLKKIKKQKKTKKINKYFGKNFLNPDKVIQTSTNVCLNCGAYDIIPKGKKSKKIFDLDFSSYGIKRNIVKLETRVCICEVCGTHSTSKSYKEAKNKHGHSIMAYSLYNKALNNLSSRQIERDINEFFGISVSHDTIGRFTSYLCEYYRSTYHLITNEIISSKVIYADETPIMTKYEDAYIWVFTNNKQVVSFYKPTK